MADLKSFAVFSENGRVGTLKAPARFLDPRTEKTIELEQGGAMVVPAESLTVQPDGSFFLRTDKQEVPPPKVPEDKLYRDGYTIERIQVDRVITEPASQRQEGETLVLPVVEEVWVMEKRTVLREEIRITRTREEVMAAPIQSR